MPATTPQNRLPTTLSPLIHRNNATLFVRNCQGGRDFCLSTQILDEKKLLESFLLTLMAKVYIYINYIRGWLVIVDFFLLE
jgi:hypothetical protein